MNKSELIEFYEKKLLMAKKHHPYYTTQGLINNNEATIDRISSLLKELKNLNRETNSSLPSSERIKP